MDRWSASTGNVRPRLGWDWFGGVMLLAVVFWWPLQQTKRVPLLGWADLGFHELGHMISYILSPPEIVMAAAGNVTQTLVPVGLAIYFWRSGRAAAAAGCLVWSAATLVDAAVYIADAPFEQLSLIGGDHDWATVLGPAHLNRLDDAAAIAGWLRFGAWGLWLAGCLWLVVVAFRVHSGQVRWADEAERRAVTPRNRRR